MVLKQTGRQGSKMGYLLGFIPSDYGRESYPVHPCKEGEKSED